MYVNIVQWHIMYPCSIFRKPTILYKCNYNLQVCSCTHKSICTCDRTLSYLSVHIYMLSVALILTPQWIFKDDYYPLSSHLSTFSIASLVRNLTVCVTKSSVISLVYKIQASMMHQKQGIGHEYMAQYSILVYAWFLVSKIDQMYEHWVHYETLSFLQNEGSGHNADCFSTVDM